MDALEMIKEKIKALYEADPHIHVSISTARPKLVIKDAPAVIVGVYRNFFLVEESSTGLVKRHTLPYTDVYIRQVVIAELPLPEPPQKP